MSVIAVVNRKGGSGKSTLATHLAAWYAHAGIPTMLGDLDRQQSTQSGLRLREARRLGERAPLVGWAVDPKRMLRPPAGVHHVVLDTPGGLRGFDLARVVTFADAIVMPVCNSVFDRESAADCYAELRTLPRVASGRCVQWQPVVEWLEPLLTRVDAAGVPATGPRPTYPCHSPSAAPARKPEPASVVAPAAAQAGETTPMRAARDEPALRRAAAGRSAGFFGWMPIPRFLQRGV
jgi:hypothetical protein